MASKKVVKLRFLLNTMITSVYLTDNETPVIMIGPGTGVAPFRAFMQEREATDANGDNWLFFGDQTFTEDFLYQVEWQSYLKSGLLKLK